MERRRKQERGEGKIGCIVTLLVLIVAGGLALKIVPEYLANDAIMESARDLASRAGVRPVEELKAQLKAKAQEKEIPEAFAPGAITINTTGSKDSGTCTIRVNYVRNVDLYGITTVKLTFDKTVSQPFMDAR